MTFWKVFWAVVLGTGIVLVLVSLVNGYLLSNTFEKIVTGVVQKTVSNSVSKDDPACINAERGFKKLPRPTPDAIRVRNPNTGRCSWAH